VQGKAQLRQHELFEVQSKRRYPVPSDTYYIAAITAGKWSSADESG